MDSRPAILGHDSVAALLAHGDDAITYFVHRDLLGKAVGSIEQIWESSAPQRIVRRQREDGSWRGPHRRTPTYPENHGDLLETFKQVRLLIERYEMTAGYEPMRRAAEYLLSFQTTAGDIRGFIGNQYATYYTGYVISLLIRSGYTDDPRIEKALRWLLAMRQDDGGWTIPMLTHTFDRETQHRLTAAYADPVEPDRTKPFSHNWTDMVLRAFAAHPDYRHADEARYAGKLLKAQFFEPDAYGSYHDGRYWTRFAFWWPNLLTAMESLLQLGFPAADADMAHGRDWFTSNQALDGLWHINNDGSAERDTPTNRERRCWLGLRIGRLLEALG